MTADLGQLVHRRGSDSLAYRRGGHALAYRGEPRTITLRIPWGPQSYVCSTYSAYHNLAFSSSVSGGETVESETSGVEHIYEVRATEAPCTLEISLAASTPCSAASEEPPEIPEMTAEVFALQRGNESLRSGRVAHLCMSSARVLVRVDEEGSLSGLEVT